jgi:hypothetical protein
MIDHLSGFVKRINKLVGLINYGVLEAQTSCFYISLNINITDSLKTISVENYSPHIPNRRQQDESTST